MFQALVTALLLFLTSSPAHSAAIGPGLFGFNDNSIPAGELGPPADANLLAGAGANSVRVTLDWSWVQPRRRRRPSFGMYDAMYRTWLAHGIRPILILTGAPPWARVPNSGCADGQPCHAPPARTHNRDWMRFVAAVARRYRLVAALEIWNEPNSQAFFQPQPDPVRYTELLKLAYVAIKRVSPTTKVLGGSLTDDLNDGDQGPENWGLRPFLRAMYAHGARRFMNGLSIHSYPRERGEGQVWDALDTALEVRDDARARVPIWLTEIGMSTTGSADQNGAQAMAAPPLGGNTRVYRESLQAAELGDLLPRLLRRPELAGVYVHTLIDPKGANPGDENTGYGVVRPDGSRKPAYCAVMRARGQSNNCSAPSLPPEQAARADAEERVQAAAEYALDWHRSHGTYRTVQPPSYEGVDATPAEDGSDSVTLCDKLMSDPRYCIKLVHDGQWAFTATDASGSTSNW